MGAPIKRNRVKQCAFIPCVRGSQSQPGKPLVVNSPDLREVPTGYSFTVGSVVSSLIHFTSPEGSKGNLSCSGVDLNRTTARIEDSTLVNSRTSVKL